MKPAFGCYKNTIRLLSGGYLDLKEPQPDQFTLKDIAGGLSKICRFGGQVKQFYSVAEHCVRCSIQGQNDGLSLETQIALLMHDAAEAFVGDVVKPVKAMLPEYAEIEAKIQFAIAEKWRINFERHQHAVEEIDHAMLIAERKRLFSRDDVTWTGENEVREISPVFTCWLPEIAELEFLIRARWLGVHGA